MVPRIHLGEKNQENLGGSPCRVKCFFEGIQHLAPGLLMRKPKFYARGHYTEFYNALWHQRAL